MSEMVERVARAIWQDRYPKEDWEYIRYLAVETPDGGNGRYLTIMRHARAAIAAMREPTEAMLDAGWHEGGEDISAMWRAMIDAAPDEPVPPGMVGDYYADPDVGPAIIAQD